MHVQRRGWCHLKARDLLFLVGYHTSRLQPCSAGHRPSSAHCAATLTSRPKPRQRKKGTCLLQAFSPASSSNPGLFVINRPQRIPARISRQSITVLLSHTARAARVCSVKVVYDLRRSNASYFSGRSALQLAGSWGRQPLAPALKPGRQQLGSDSRKTIGLRPTSWWSLHPFWSLVRACS